MQAYYNEIDSFCCDWLSNLMDAGHITPGRIDDRDIREVQPEDLKGFERVHMFCGIAGWDLALNLSGWRGPVWTGSCPCQPFSAAGQGQGADDERHLWPAFYRLIAECEPSTVFGEQVASKLGRTWMSAVRADLEDLGYAVGAADLCAAGVGAPHIRQRLYWVADADGGERGRLASGEGREHDREETRRVEGYRQPERGGQDGRVVNPIVEGLERHAGDGDRGHEPGRVAADTDRPVAPASAWSDIEWIPCSDGKSRPAQPGIFPLASRTSGRVGQLRAYGNSIVPAVADMFIRSTMETKHD